MRQSANVSQIKRFKMLVVFSLNFVADTKFSVIISELLCGDTGKYLLNNKKVTAEKNEDCRKNEVFH